MPAQETPHGLNSPSRGAEPPRWETATDVGPPAPRQHHHREQRHRIASAKPNRRKPHWFLAYLKEGGGGKETEGKKQCKYVLVMSAPLARVCKTDKNSKLWEWLLAWAQANQSIITEVQAALTEASAPRCIAFASSRGRKNKLKTKKKVLEAAASRTGARQWLADVVRRNDLSECPVFTAHEKRSLFRINYSLGVEASRLYILVTSRMEEIKLKTPLPRQHGPAPIRMRFSTNTPHPPWREICGRLLARMTNKHFSSENTIWGYKGWWCMRGI